MGKVLKPEAAFWKEQSGFVAQAAMQAAGLQPIYREKFAVNVWAWWLSKRSQIDADGALKLVLDSLNGIVWSDDKFSLPRWIDYDFDAKNPRIELEIICPPPILLEAA